MADKKKFEIPALDGDDLTLESIAEHRAAAVEAARGIDAITAAPEEVAELEAILDFVAAADVKKGELESAAAEDAARREAAVAALAALDEAPAAEVEPEPAGDPAPAEDPEPAAEPVEAEAELVTASAGNKRSIAAQAAAQKGPEVIVTKDAPKGPKMSITAAAGVSEFTLGQELADMSEVTAAFLARVGSFGSSNPKDMKPGVYQMTQNFTRHGVANMKRDNREHAVDNDMSLEKQFEIIMQAGDEANRFGGFGGLAQKSLTAAGGWCAPSETLYDLFSYHTNAGLLDIPEVTARRGGIQFTKGPDFMTIFGDSDAGFIQTEAQAEAGTTKPCFALDCPPFTEVRLDAIGFCATAPILTEAAYPELVRQVLSMLGTGHARRKSATTISRIVASTTAGTGALAPVTFAPVGGAGNQSGLADSLAAVELRANQIRQSLAMDPNATIEGMTSWWARGAFRTELSRRLGIDNPMAVTDAMIDQFFAVRNIRLQYPYDLNMLGTGAAGTAGGTAGWTAWPTTLDFHLWPAGAFTRLVNDVIKLDAVFDHDLLTGNEYTAAFVEEGIAVANTRGFGLKTTVVLNPQGSSGFPAIGAGEDVTFAAA